MKQIRKATGFAPADRVHIPAFYLTGLLYAPAFTMLVAALATIASASGLQIRSIRQLDSHAPREKPR